ncbi:hypothetical protein M011DRAFT_471006 [Sporormia fimetaria CBS 119925]|uniref:Uncharacterized protein n=1 Tax=Sporormia fimetaria CBS 119925 TaxID=1340428 RepID=A0A6A6V030_9PLEO|nr:hypothetical protein M011DRAFT_471006 [Sporormia fimetaria CBS 119925]
MSDPSKPPDDGRCVFLEIPGEIRNHIYDLVLHEPGGLHFMVPSEHDSLPEPAPKLCARHRYRSSLLRYHEANQLQYVNKQIRLETKGRGLKVNTMHFHCGIGTYSWNNWSSASHLCLQFLEDLHPELLPHLRLLQVNDSGYGLNPSENRKFHTEHFEGTIMSELIKTCRKNTHINVNIIDCWGKVDPDAYSCIMVGDLLKLAVGAAYEDDALLHHLYDVHHSATAAFLHRERAGNNSTSFSEVDNVRICVPIWSPIPVSDNELQGIQKLIYNTLCVGVTPKPLDTRKVAFFKVMRWIRSGVWAKEGWKDDDST